MPKNIMFLWLVLGLTPATVFADSDPNAARREEVFEAKFGQIFSDPYRWMENPDDAELRRWVAAENQRLAEQTRGALFEAVRSEFQQILAPAANVTAATDRIDRLFDTRRLTQRRNIRFRHRPTISVPDVIAPESGLEFSRFVSPNGRYEVVVDADASRDLGRLAIIDRKLSTETEVRLPDSLTVRFTSVYWETNDSSFTPPASRVVRRVLSTASTGTGWAPPRRRILSSSAGPSPEHHSDSSGPEKPGTSTSS